MVVPESRATRRVPVHSRYSSFSTGTPMMVVFAINSGQHATRRVGIVFNATFSESQREHERASESKREPDAARDREKAIRQNGNVLNHCLQVTFKISVLGSTY